jgi:hypothetical protein
MNLRCAVSGAAQHPIVELDHHAALWDPEALMGLGVSTWNTTLESVVIVAVRVSPLRKPISPTTAPSLSDTQTGPVTTATVSVSTRAKTAAAAEVRPDHTRAALVSSRRRSANRPQPGAARASRNPKRHRSSWMVMSPRPISNNKRVSASGRACRRHRSTRGCCLSDRRQPQLWVRREGRRRVEVHLNVGKSVGDGETVDGLTVSDVDFEDVPTREARPVAVSSSGATAHFVNRTTSGNNIVVSVAPTIRVVLFGESPKANPPVAVTLTPTPTSASPLTDAMTLTGATGWPGVNDPNGSCSTTI